jgi:type IV pilus assembly protein PilV
MAAGRQSGSVLLEGLFAILIFSMGVLAIVGLQLASMKQSSAGKYRTEASMLANDLISQMWLSDRNTASLQTNFATGGARYTAWLAQVQQTLPTLNRYPPTVAVEEVAGATGSTPSSRVTVTVYWKAPADPSGATVNQFTAIAQIK